MWETIIFNNDFLIYSGIPEIRTYEIQENHSTTVIYMPSANCLVAGNRVF